MRVIRNSVIAGLGVNLLGIDSVTVHYERRVRAWGRVVSDLPMGKLEAMVRPAVLADLPGLGASILKGGVLHPTGWLSLFYNESTSAYAAEFSRFNHDGSPMTIDDGTDAVDNEVSPRQQIVASAYALRARYAEQLGSNGGTALTALATTVLIGCNKPLLPCYRMMSRRCIERLPIIICKAWMKLNNSTNFLRISIT